MTVRPCWWYVLYFANIIGTVTGTIAASWLFRVRLLCQTEFFIFLLFFVFVIIYPKFLFRWILLYRNELKLWLFDSFDVQDLRSKGMNCATGEGSWTRSFSWSNEGRRWELSTDFHKWACSKAMRLQKGRKQRLVSYFFTIIYTGR